jgi:predicted amidophosphoribosyltransferase
VCADCGAAARDDDAFCRRCGAELYEREPARGAHGR